MAAAISSVENAQASRSAAAAAAVAPAPQRAGRQHAPANTRSVRQLQPRLSSASSSASRDASFISLPSGTRGGTSASGGRGGGAISGVFASVLSLGAAALPSSLMIFSTSSPATPRRPRRQNSASAAAAVPAAARGINASLQRSSSAPLYAGALPAAVEDAAAVGGDGAHAAAAGAAAAGAGGGGVEEAAGIRVAVVENASPVVGVGGAGAGAGAGGKPATQKVYLEGGSSVYTCSMCRAHLATRDHVVSECFHGHGGRAFLFERCVNVAAGRPEDRLLMTGMHVVADISCASCGAELGWKYEEAAEKSQKYKKGKFILERCAVTLEGGDGDGRHGSDRFGSERFGSERCGSNSIIGWGADKAPFADGARW